MKQVVLLLIIVFSSVDIFAERVLLHVRAKHEQSTDYYPVGTCEDDTGDIECIPGSYWNIYSAKIKKVVMGRFSDRSIKFGILQHSRFVDYILKDMYIQIEEFSSQGTIEKLGTKYYVDDWAFPKTVVCFRESLDSEFPNEKDITSEYGNCYNINDLLYDDDDA